VIEPRRWTVDITPVARRELLTLRGAIQDRLRAAIRALGDDPISPDSIVMRGKGVGLRRLRVGNYRIIYRLQSERLMVLVVRVGHRSEVYEGFEDL